MVDVLHYNLVMNLHDLFSNTEAAAHLNIDVDVFRFDERITGIPVGQRADGFTGEPKPFTWVYTRRMLDDYTNGRFPITPTDDELHSVLSTEEAADLLGVATTAVSQRVYRGTLPSKKVGKMRMFLRWDIEQALRQGKTIVPTVGMAERLANWREANGRSLASLEEPLGVSRETIRVFETGKMNKIPATMHAAIVALLEDK